MRQVLTLSCVLLVSSVFAVPVVWHSRVDGGDLLVRVPDVEFGRVSEGGVEYAVLRLTGAGFSNDVGQPQMPVYRRLIEVPYGATVTVEAYPVSAKRYQLAERLLPRQASVPKTGPAPEFTLDGKTYARDEFLGEFGAGVVEAGVMRGHRLVLVEVSPARYNPVRGEFELATEMKVVVRWRGADWVETRARAERYDAPPFAGRLAGVTLNRVQFDFAPPDLPVGYLVIVPDEWEGNVAPLAQWRRRRGFHVFVRNLTQVGGSSADAVRDYIQDAYDNWPIPPSFVLLVGDVDRIGYFTGQGTGSPNTDLNFGMVEGADYFPDIDVSRASVVNAAQLDSLVRNVLTYEQVGGSGGSAWLNRAYFIASSDGGNHQIAEGTHAYVMAKLRAINVECDSQWLYYGQGTPIVDALNGGRAWVTYSGHGSTTAWADPSPSFDVDAVHALINVDMIPYVQTYACLSGNFASSSNPECFSEAWLRSGRRGGIAHIASSVNSYWEEDDTLERRVFDCMFDSSFHWIMGGYNRAKLIFYEQMGSGGGTRRYFEMYNMMGDGAIDVFAHEPSALTVLHPPVIPLGNYPLQVTVTAGGGPVEDALVCAMAVHETSVFAAGYTDASGAVTLNVNTVSPDSIYVTVTGHDLEPYLGSCQALPSGGPYVMYLGHTVDDSAGGNNDGIINPGESINLMMWVKNWGSETANGVETRLRTDDSNIALVDSVKVFGDIPAGDSAYTGSDGFDFTVAGACTNGYALQFTIRSRDANDSVWETPLALFVGAPVLDYAAHEADDPPPGGNGNRMIEPGETGNLIVTLRNTGQGNAYGVTAVLRSGDTRLSVLDSLGAFGDIARDTTGSNAGNPFRVQADNTIPRETQIPCTLAVTVGGAVYVREFVLEIGAIRVCDPIPDGPRTPALYYAYDATDTLYTESPVFEWVDITGVGTRLDLSDDQTVQVQLPSAFGQWSYYGQRYSEVSICGNGWVAPGHETYTGYSNRSLPDNGIPGMVCLNWDDLYPPQGNGVWHYHDAANHRFIIQYDSMPFYANRDVCNWFQLVIYDSTLASPGGNNVFVAQYLTADGYSSNTVGIQDPNRAIAIECLFDGSYHRGAAELIPGMAIKYSATPPSVGISDKDGEHRPLGRVALSPCRPNPVRHSARLSFAVPRPMRVRLSVFDATGRKMVDLFDGPAAPGLHSVNWDGRDAQGRRLAAGVYLYRLQTDTGTVSRKLVLTD